MSTTKIKFTPEEPEGNEGRTKRAASATGRGLKAFGRGLGVVLSAAGEAVEAGRESELKAMRMNYASNHRQATTSDIFFGSEGVNDDGTVCLSTNCPNHPKTGEDHPSYARLHRYPRTSDFAAHNETNKIINADGTVCLARPCPLHTD